MRQITGTPLDTRPKYPLGPVMHCLCGRWNDAGRERSCPDCERPIYSMMGVPAKSHYEAEEEARREYVLSQAAAYSLGLFVAHDLREAA